MTSGTRDQIDLLDDALSGLPADDSVVDLTKLAEGLRGSLQVPTPQATGARALFVQGASSLAKRHHFPRLLVPSIAMGLLIVVVAALSRTALPGTALYQVRKVLASVDLAPSAQHEVDARLDRARFELSLAESRLPDNPAAALAAANVALEQLGQARSFLDDIGAGERAKDIDAIASLEARADSVIAQAHEAEKSHSPSGGSPQSGSDDRSGAGSARSGRSGNRGEGSESPGSNRGKGSHDTGESHRSGSSDHRGSNGGSNDHGSQGSDDAHGGSSQGSDHAASPSPSPRGGHDTGTDHSGKDGSTSGSTSGDTSQSSGDDSTSSDGSIDLGGTSKGGGHEQRRHGALR